jgi:citrate lyase subunit beta/citryl-CoA lyase
MALSQPLRSILFVPGNKGRMLEKARSLRADAVILDLEDSVPPGEKALVRETVRRALEGGAFRPQVILPLNALSTSLAEPDLQEAFHPKVEAICLPKAEGVSDVERLASMLETMEMERGLPTGAVEVLLIMEAALGALAAYDMARASQRVRALGLGGEDLARDLGAVRTREGKELRHARAHLVIAARAAGAVAIDTIYADLKDFDGLLADARRARQLGYSGKLLIHPAQIEPVHSAFTPSRGEMEYARRVVEAFEAAEERSEAVIALEGQMIDAPVGA